jgi:hypothetical protein
VIGLATVVATAIAVTVLIGVGESSDTGGTASGSNGARDASPGTPPIAEETLAPPVSANLKPDSGSSRVEAGPGANPDGDVSGIPAQDRRARSPREKSSVDVRPLPTAPEVPSVSLPGKTPGRRILMDIDDRRPPGPEKTREEPRRVVTDIDVRLPVGGR